MCLSCRYESHIGEKIQVPNCTRRSSNFVCTASHVIFAQRCFFFQKGKKREQQREIYNYRHMFHYFHLRTYGLVVVTMFHCFVSSKLIFLSFYPHSTLICGGTVILVREFKIKLCRLCFVCN